LAGGAAKVRKARDTAATQGAVRYFKRNILPPQTIASRSMIEAGQQTSHHHLRSLRLGEGYNQR
jgi:hypothetical protein